MYISNRQETREELLALHEEIFNWETSEDKKKRFFELCEMAHSVSPSDRCKDKKCVIGPACGNLDAKIMFIAEAPGRNGAERTGIPIYGDPSGDNFERIISASTQKTLSRKDLFLTNTFFWNPTNENGNNDRPTKKEIEFALPFLNSQIEIVDPELIIALGMTAYSTLGKIHPLPTQGSMKDLAGKVFPWTDRRLLGVMYHPSPRVTNTHRPMAMMIQDMKSTLKEYVKKRKSLCR